MPLITFHKNGQTYQDEIKAGSNLVVRAGIKQYPYPHLAYQCGMGKCATCACKIIAGAENLPAPNWKEKKQLGDRLDQGFRLVCQLWPEHDLELEQIPADNAAAAAASAASASNPATPAA